MALLLPSGGGRLESTTLRDPSAQEREAIPFFSNLGTSRDMDALLSRLLHVYCWICTDYRPHLVSFTGCRRAFPWLRAGDEHPVSGGNGQVQRIGAAQ